MPHCAGWQTQQHARYQLHLPVVSCETDLRQESAFHEQYRERLKRAGIDPDQVGIHGFGAPLQPRQPLQSPLAPGHVPSGDHPTENPAHFLGMLEELHDTGVLDDEEYGAARTRLLESLRA